MNMTSSFDIAAMNNERMKSEHLRHLVNTNFYGLQSKIKNPMSSPDWKLQIQKDDEST